MILASNRNSAAHPKLKKKLNLANLEDTPLNSTVSCEFGPDGIQFMRANIKITKNGMSKVTGDQILPLSIVGSDDVEYGAEIGKGASAIVQEGIYKPDNIPIAIKTINVYDKDKRHQVVNDLKNFLHDRLEHIKGNYPEFSSHIVQVYGAYYDEGSIKIIMELMDAGSLRQIYNMSKKVSQTAPYIEEAYLANITYQILEGLNFIHTKKKQIHRDIKPENVLINSLGQVKLTDFGISKQLEQTHAFSKTFVGTVSYMSPERLVGEKYSFSSDIWSLGLVLIELATGEYPYPKTKTFIEMLQSITTSPEPNLPDNGQYSTEFRDFIRRCLNKDAAKRSSAGELLGHPWLLKNSEINLDLSEWVCNLLFTCKYGYTQQPNGNEDDLNIIEEEPNLNGEFEEEDDYHIRENITTFSEVKEEEDPTKRYENAMKKIESYYNYSTDGIENQSSFLNKSRPSNNGFEEEIPENIKFNGGKTLKFKNGKMAETDLEVENLEYY